MNSLDEIFDVLQKIKDKCNLHGKKTNWKCDTCPFVLDDHLFYCQFIQIADLFYREPALWDLKKLKEILDEGHF